MAVIRLNTALASANLERDDDHHQPSNSASASQSKRSNVERAADAVARYSSVRRRRHRGHRRDQFGVLARGRVSAGVARGADETGVPRAAVVRLALFA